MELLIPGGDELKTAFLTWLATNKPTVLDDEVQTYLASFGHDILWTPPYVPELQPIELFWGVGKNYAGYAHYKDRTMKETVGDLRDGWYGNVHWPAPTLDPDGNEVENSAAAVIRKNEGIRHLAVNCNALTEVAIKEADKRIAWCAGIQGSVYGGVTVTPGYNADAAIPIDLVFDASIGDEHHNPVVVDGDGVQQQGGEIDLTEVPDDDGEEAEESDSGGEDDEVDDLDNSDEEGRDNGDVSLVLTAEAVAAAGMMEMAASSMAH